MVAWEGDFWGDFDLSRGFQTIEIESCQDMEKSIWDLWGEVIYTISLLNLSPPYLLWRAYGVYGVVWWGGLVGYNRAFLAID